MNLTPREYEVARLSALGRSAAEIMAELHMGSDTYYKHRAAAMQKADVGSMPEVWAALGWLVVPRASDSDVTSSAGSVVAVTRTPSHREAA